MRAAQDFAVVTSGLIMYKKYIQNIFFIQYIINAKFMSLWTQILFNWLLRRPLTYAN